VNNKLKQNLGFFWNVALIFGLITALSFIVDPTSHLADHNLLLTQNKNTTSQILSEQPQYQLIIDLQKSFVRNAKDIGPSVVNISKVHEVIKPSTSYKTPTSDKYTWFPTLKSWIGNKFRKNKYYSETIGSGVIINKNGYILTNNHVIENKDKILIRLSDNRDFWAKVVGKDPLTDLAVLKINSFRSLPHLALEPARDVAVGQWVMAIGNPYGLQGSVTVGIISGVGRSDLGITTYESFIQTDASINPGNSGGPLIDLNGKIIGINTSAVAVGSGIGFAIPVEIAMRTVEGLIDSGYVERGWLGVGIQGITPELAASFKISSTENGILVNNVGDYTPAKNGGMMRGDVVIQYDGKWIRNTKNFKQMVGNTQVGKKVSIKVIRDGHEKILLVTVGKLNS